MYSELLDRIEQYLEQREDVRDGSDRTPLPNEAMDLLMRLREARRETPRHSTPRPEGMVSTDRDNFASALISIALTADEDNEWDGTEKFREVRATAMKALKWTDQSKPQPSDS